MLGDELTEQLPFKADFQTLQADFKALEAQGEGLRSTLTLMLVGLLVALGLVEPVSKLLGS